VRFEQMTEAAHCRLVRHRLAAEIDSGKAAHPVPSYLMMDIRRNTAP
jgi:hypothetical protein